MFNSFFFYYSLSLQVSIFAQYLITLMTITCACIMLSVIILRLYHRPETAIVGPKTKTVIRVLRRVLCLSTTPARLESYDIAQNAISPAPQEIRPNSRYVLLKKKLEISPDVSVSIKKRLHVLNTLSSFPSHGIMPIFNLPL